MNIMSQHVRFDYGGQQEAIGLDTNCLSDMARRVLSDLLQEATDLTGSITFTEQESEKFSSNILESQKGLMVVKD